MGLLQPLGLLALLSVPVIVLMYLWKQKYQQKQVPSLFLWEKVLTQTKSQQPWQKLKKNKLMLLQIVAAVLLSFALAAPFVAGSMQVQDAVLALDCSLSMQTTDGKQSRFDLAKKDMMAWVEQSADNSSFSLVMLTDTPFVAVSDEQDKQTILKLLEKAQPTAGGVDWETAKTLLVAEQDALGGDILLYTDDYGNLGTMQAVEQIYNQQEQNTAVTLLSHTLQADGGYVLARLHWYGTGEVQKTVTLFADGAVYDTKTVTISAEQDADVVFEGVPEQTKTVEVHISPEDALSMDDVRYLGVGKAQTQKVLLVTKGNVFLEKALSLLEQVDFYKTEETQTSGYGLYIFDGVMPDVLPTDGHLLFLNSPKNDLFTVEAEQNFSGLVKGADGTGLENIKDIAFALQKGTPLSANWGKALLQTEGKSLGLFGETNGRKIAALGFDLHNSDFPLQTTFPVLWYRLMEWYFPEQTAGISQSVSGQAISFALKPDTQKAVVQTAKGKEIAILPPTPARTLTETTQTGWYLLKETDAKGNTITTPFGVNAQTVGESDLRLTKEAAEQTATTNKTIHAGKPITIWLLLLLLGVILIEWWVNCREN